MQRKWIGIRASAGLSIAGSLAILAMGGVTLFGTLAAPPRTGPAAPPFPMAAIGIVMAAMSACFSGWGIWTAVGIFRRRGWARVSIVVFAILLAFMGVGGGLAVFFMPSFPAQQGVSQGMMETIRWGVAGFYGVLAAIGVWWLVLFNLSSTKQYFAPDAASEPRARPLSVSMIGWYLVISSLFMAAAAVVRMPAFVFGAVVTGWGGLAVYAVFAGAQVFLGTGLLHLREQARLGTIGYFCLMALSSALTVPGFDGKMQVLQREMPRLFPAGVAMQYPQPVWVFVLMGMVFAAIPVWFLVRHHAAFVKLAAAP